MRGVHRRMLSRIYVRDQSMYLTDKPGLYTVWYVPTGNVQDGWVLGNQQHCLRNVRLCLYRGIYVRVHGVYLSDEPGLPELHAVYNGIYLPDDSLHCIGEPGLHTLHDVRCGIYIRDHSVHSSRGEPGLLELRVCLYRGI